MLSRRTVLSFTASIAGLAAPPLPASAHRLQEGQTVISWNAKMSNLEVIHTFHLHDAEQALSLMGKLESPDLTNLRARATLALYTQEQFLLAGLDGRPISLSILGAEVEGGFINVYQESKLAERPSGLAINNTLFQNIYPAQVNLVNVILGKEIRSVYFKDGDGIKKVLA